jgi:hypothetical protein
MPTLSGLTLVSASALAKFILLAASHLEDVCLIFAQVRSQLGRDRCTRELFYDYGLLHANIFVLN